MTLKEKVAEVKPECVDDDYTGGVRGCPDEYDYLHACKSEHCSGADPECSMCWNREYIPENRYNIKNTCESCKYHDCEALEEPCKSCVHHYGDSENFVLSDTNEQADDNIEDKNTQNILHCTSDYDNCIKAMTDIFGADSVRHYYICNAFECLWNYSQNNDIRYVRGAITLLEKLVEWW